jgi:endoglucanase
LESAENVYSKAQTENIKQLTTADPFDYYPETEWRDDMEFGATQLYIATKNEIYLKVKQ